MLRTAEVACLATSIQNSLRGAPRSLLVQHSGGTTVWVEPTSGSAEREGQADLSSSGLLDRSEGTSAGTAGHLWGEKLPRLKFPLLHNCEGSRSPIGGKVPPPPRLDCAAVTAEDAAYRLMLATPG